MRPRREATGTLAPTRRARQLERSLLCIAPMRRALSNAAGIARDTARAWWSGNSLQLGAALAYYTVFSLAPVLAISIAVAGLVLGADAARDGILEQLGSLVGPQGAEVIQSIVEQAALRPKASIGATAIGIATLLFGASGAFGQLQRALNDIWEVETKPSGIAGVLRRRLVSVGTVLVLGFLLLVSLVVSAAIAALGRLASWDFLGPVLAAIELVASLGIATLLFAAIYKLLPDRPIRWADVWVGAAATALLFEIGKSAIALYLGRAGVASMYGAAGSVVILLLWIYYSAQILFLGAEFTKVWAGRHLGKSSRSNQRDKVSTGRATDRHGPPISNGSPGRMQKVPTARP